MSTKAIFGLAFALTTALASPAFARTTPHTGAGAFERYETRHSAHPGWDVYDDRGWYRGTDPDPFIRSQLGRCREC